MRKNNTELSDAELEIMNVIWDSRGEISSAEILKSEVCRDWKRTTVSTFLSRLVEKGAVNVRKEGAVCLYSALLDRSEYRQKKTDSFIKSFYSGSAKQLAISLLGSKKLSKEDIDELRKMFLGEE